MITISKNKNKSSRYYVQGIDFVWNNKKGVVAIVGKIEEFLSFYPWIVFYVASNDISFGHKGTPSTHSMFHNSSYKILLQLICLSSLSRNICRSPHRIKNVHAFNLILDMYIIMCEGGYVLCDKQWTRGFNPYIFVVKRRKNLSQNVHFVINNYIDVLFYTLF